MLYATYFFRDALLFVFRKRYHERIAQDLRFLNVRMPRNESGTDKSDDAIQSMKQNIEVMNQVFKNFYAIAKSGWRTKLFGNPSVSCEILVDKEVITFNLAVPRDYAETFEKIISSFYTGSVIDQISPPLLLEEGKYADGGYIVLAKDNPFPIKTYENFEVDPMDGILAWFARVSIDEKLCLQIMTQPLKESRQKRMRDQVEEIKEWWGESRWKKLFKFWSDDDDKGNEQNSDYSSSQLQAIEQKAEDEWFDVVMRVLATSPDASRPKKIVDDVLRWLFQYNYVWLNSFSYLNAKNIHTFMKEFVLRQHTRPYFTWENMMFVIKSQILNIKEVSSIFHFPHIRFNKNPRIKRQKFKIVPAPDNLPVEGMILGDNLYGWVKKEIRLSRNDRFRHFYIIWQTGTGKSTILRTMINQDMANGVWFTLIDPHGDLAEACLEYFPKDRIDDLIYRDAGNTELPFWFNFLKADGESEMDLVTNDAVDMFVQLYGPEIFGPRIQDYFRNAVLCLMEQPEWWTLTEIVRLFTDEAYQKIKVKNVKNPVVRARRDKTYAKMWDREKGEMIPYFQSKFGNFTTTPLLRNIIGQPESSFNIWEAMDSGKVILINLSKWVMGDINSNLLGMMVVSQIRLGAFRRASIPEHERVPHFLYIDEFQNFVTPSIESILSEARKYKLWLILAHQYLEQLKSQWAKSSTDLETPIFGNVGNMMCYRIWVKDMERMEQQFSPQFSANDLVNLDKFKWVIKMSVDMQPTPAFSINVRLPREQPALNSPEKMEIIKQISALKYGRKKELVEKEVFFRVGA